MKKSTLFGLRMGFVVVSISFGVGMLITSSFAADAQRNKIKPRPPVIDPGFPGPILQPVQPPLPPPPVVLPPPPFRPAFSFDGLNRSFDGPQAGSRYILNVRTGEFALQNPDGSRNAVPLQRDRNFVAPQGGSYRFDRAGQLFFEDGRGGRDRLFQDSNLKRFLNR